MDATPATELVEQEVIEGAAQEAPVGEPPETLTGDPAQVSPAPARKRRASRTSRAKQETPATLAPPTDETFASPVGGETPAISPEQATPAAEAKQKPARKPRTRRRKAEPAPSEETLPAETPTIQDDGVAVIETPPPVVIRHPVARVQFQQGVPRIVFGEQTLSPFLFFGNPHTPEAAMRVHQQMQLASESGVRLFALLIGLPARSTGAIEAFDSIRYWTMLAREVNPDALMLWRIVPVPVGNWQKEFAEAVIRFADGTVGGPSVCADRWWEIVQAQLTELVRLVEQEEEGASTVGYHLDWGEWFLPESGGYDTSEAAQQAFRDWLRRHFRNDTVNLRASWFSGEVSFSTASIPPFVPNAPLTRRQFYEPRREGRWIDYHQFISDAIARRILSLARTVKEACQHRCLVGASYGYVLEWRHPYSGHLMLNALLQSEEIDFLSAPITYADRLPGGTGACPLPVESVHLHQKLFLSEEDYRTPFGKVMRLDRPATEHSLTPGTGGEEDYNPPLRSADAVAQVQSRSMMQALVHGFGEAWMDLWGEGWLLHPAVWERFAEFRKLWAMRERLGQVEPDLAVVVDPMSLSYVRVGSPLIQQVVGQAREVVMRAGLSYGFYLLDDVLRRDFPRARMVLFLNAWNLKPSVREAIRSRLQRDGRVLIWLYAASLFDNHRHALETAREVTGLALALQPWASTQGSQIVDPLHPIVRRLKSGKLGVQQRWEPSFYVLADEGRVLGEYIETGLPSLVVAEYEHWRTVFIGERMLTPELLQGIADWAGVHVWCDTNDVVQVRPPLIHLHASRGGEKCLNLPLPLSVYDLTEGMQVAEEVHAYRLGMNEGESRLFLVAPAVALDALLAGEGEIDELLQAIRLTPPVPEVLSEEPSTVRLDEEAIALVQPLTLEAGLHAEPPIGEVPSSQEGEAPAEPKPAKRRRTRKKSAQAPPDELLQTVRWRKQKE